jgi:hypothetical protein
MEQTLNALASGGIMIIDDISTHQAFAYPDKTLEGFGLNVAPCSKAL